METTGPVLDLSSLIGRPLLDSGGERLGRVEDVIVRLDSGDELPPVTGLKARIGGRDAFVPADRISRLEPGAARTSTTKLNLAQFERRPGEVLLRGDLLGRSVIDVTTARLVKVRDVELVDNDGTWRVTGIDPSLGAGVRRRLPRLLRGREHEHGESVPWPQTEPFVAHVPSSRLRLAHRRLARLHPAQIADLVDRRIPVLNLLPAAKQLKIKRLLGYNPSTAGGLMNPDFPVLPAAATVADGQEYVRRSELAPSQLLVLWIVDEGGSLIGGVFSSELLIGQERAPVTSLIESAVPTVTPETELPEVARLMSDFNLLVIPVIDSDRKPIGVVAFDDVLELLVPEEWRRRAGEARG